MKDEAAAQEFAACITPVVQRFFAQNGRTSPTTDECAVLAHRMWVLVEERGLPPPLAPGDPGVPGGMSDEEVSRLVDRVLESSGDELLTTVVKQLVKACFYPEFTVCRDSFREPTKDGGCRRQELARVRGRVSGSHCVDCPHFVALDPAEHAAFLAREWRVGGPEALAAHRAIFLPGDFRALRCWLHAQARKV